MPDEQTPDQTQETTEAEVAAARLAEDSQKAADAEPAQPAPSHAEIASDARVATLAEALEMVQEEDPEMASLMVTRYGGYNAELCRARSPKLYARIRRP